ncbi:hypothetical protein ACWKWU_03180 [Chitinophaga lutea]
MKHLVHCTFIVLLFSCTKIRTPEPQVVLPPFLQLPDGADRRLAAFTSQLERQEKTQPFLDEVLRDVGKPRWTYAAFGVQGSDTAVMVPLVNGRVTGLLVMALGNTFKYRVFDARRPEQYGFSDQYGRANARSVFIAADLFNQRMFEDAPAVMDEPCMLSRRERAYLANARASNSSAQVIAKALPIQGYIVTCFTSVVCTGDGRGNCIDEPVTHTECLYNYIWLEGYEEEDGYIGGSSGDGYSVGGGWEQTYGADPCGGGAVEGGDLEALKVMPPDKPILNVLDYLRCIFPFESSRITFYVDQPDSDGSDFSFKEKAGHAYIAIEQVWNGTMTRRTFGFYPLKDVTPYFPKGGVSQLGDDAGREYDVSLEVVVPGNVTAAIIKFVLNYSPTYHIEDYNCTNFVLDIADICGLNIPRNKSSWLGGTGLSPARLGEDLKKFSDAHVRTGKSIANIGMCF